MGRHGNYMLQVDRGSLFLRPLLAAGGQSIARALIDQ